MKLGWASASAKEIGQAHEQWLMTPAWIIDGWGSWDAIAARFELADTIVVVDLRWHCTTGGRSSARQPASFDQIRIGRRPAAALYRSPGACSR
jgi:hypothetical protein